MNCLPNMPTEPASGRNQVVVSVITSETTFLSSEPGNATFSELELEAEMHRRAGVITDVLARIIERPAAPRYWGLNE
jgi:hypothetical protein